MKIRVTGVDHERKVVSVLVLVRESTYDLTLAQEGRFWTAWLADYGGCCGTYPQAAFTPEQAAACLVQNFPLRLHPVLGSGRIG